MPGREQREGSQKASQAIAAARAVLAEVRDRGVAVSTETRSMAPLLRGGERLFWQPPEPAPRFGDIVIFHQPSARIARESSRPREGAGPELDTGGSRSPLAAALQRSLVVHRVVWLRRDGCLRTKGDGLPHLDLGAVEPEAVLGVVTRVSEGDGRARRFEGRRARLYGRLAASLSLLGAGGYRLCAIADAACARVLPVFRRRVFRRLGSFGQRVVQGTLHLCCAPFLVRRTPEDSGPHEGSA